MASLGLLADASEVMVKLEEVVYNTALSGSEREQLIHRGGHRLLMAMDRAEGVVRKFGHASAMRKMFQSLEAAQGHFEDVTEEIGKVSLVADAGGLASMKMMMMSNSEAALSGPANGASYGMDGASIRQASLGMSLDGLMSGLEQPGVRDGVREGNWEGAAAETSAETAAGLEMASVSVGRQSGVQAVADPVGGAQSLPTDNGAPYAMGRVNSASVLQTRMSLNPPTARIVHSASTALSKTDGVSIVTDFTSMELFKGSKQAFLEAGTLGSRLVPVSSPLVHGQTHRQVHVPHSMTSETTTKQQVRASSWRRPMTTRIARRWARSCGSTRPRSWGRTG